MNYARRLTRRAASRKGRAAVKDQNRRGFFAERLEDRSLMAADVLSNFHNYSSPKDVNADGEIAPSDVLVIINSINSLGARQLPQSGGEGESGTGYVDVDLDGSVAPNDVLTVINYLNAEGEAGSTLPQKARYTLQILDSSGTPLTTASYDSVTGELLPSSNRTATIRKDSDFYVQLVDQDVRPAGTDPIKGTPLARGIFAAYTDILFDTNFATIAANETQAITNDSAEETGTFTLTLPTNASGISGTTAPITFSADTAATATNIRNGLNTALFGGSQGTRVRFDSATSRYLITFIGINNVSLPLLTSNSVDVNATEILDGNANNTLAAYQAEADGTGVIKYGNGISASLVDSYGLNDVGAFAGLDPLGRGAIPVFRIHMIAKLPSGSTGTVVFTPDPLGDGSGSTQDMVRGDHNTLVYGNENVKDPSGAIDPDTGAVAVAEIEKSLVIFSETNNEFRNLTPVTLSINTGPYTAVPDPGAVDENTTAAGTNTVSIPVLSNDTLTGATGTLEIKSFDATTTGGTITQSGNNLIFKPNAGFNGTATFTYVGGIVGNSNANDTAVGTVTVTVAAVNSAPIVTVPGAQNASSENTDVVFSAANGNAITVADADVAETAPGELLMTLTTSANSTLTLGSTAGINSVTGDGTAQITFKGTPAAVNTALSGLKLTSSGQSGNTVTVSIKADDQGNTGKPVGTALTDTKTISVVFPSVNDAPAISIGGVDISGVTTNVVGGPNQDFDFTAKGKAIAVTDVDAASGNLTVTLALGGTGTDKLTATGTGVSGSGTRTLTITGPLSTIATALGTVVYTPATGSTASATITITANDGGNTGTGGAQTTVGTVVVDLDPGVRPFPVDDSALINEANTNTPATLTIDALANDFQAVGATTTIVSVTQPPAGQGSVVINNNKLEYTPPTNSPDFFTPTTPVRFTYTIHDDVAGSTDRTGTVSITVKNVIDTPVANADGVGNSYKATFANGVGSPLVVPAASGVLANDTNVDNNFGNPTYAAQTAVVVSQPTKGTLSLNGDGSFTYTPTSFDINNANDTFTYKVVAVSPEGTVESSPATVTIHVTAPPALQSGHVDVNEGQASTITVDSFYSDASESSPLASVSIVTNLPAGKGTISVAGDGKSFIYTPPDNDFNTSRPAGIPDLTFTYRAKSQDNRDSNVATLSITVKDVNDAPTAANDTFLAVKKNAAGTIGVNQEINVLGNDSILPDVAVAGDESLSVTGISLSAGGPFTAGPLTTAAGGSVRLSGGKILYDSPTNAPVSDSFFYQISDNSAAGRNGPLLASAKVDISVVDFVPKTISGSVYVDSNGDGIKDKALGGVEVRLIGVDFTDKVLEDTVGKGYLSVTTDANGNYTFPASGIGLAPPKAGTSYQLVEVQPKFLSDGLDKYADSTPNLDTTTNLPLVLLTNSTVPASGLENAFNLKWSVTDLSGNLTDINFVEGGINTDPTTGGLTNSAGLKGELLASSGKNGFIVATDASTGAMLWDWSIEGDINALQGATLLSAQLSSDLSLLTVTMQNGTGLHTVTLTQGYSIPGSSARFRILGYGSNGQYIIRIDGSYNGTTIDPRTGLYDGMFVSNSATLQGAEGEAPAYRDFTNSADAVFNEQAWA